MVRLSHRVRAEPRSDLTLKDLPSDLVEQVSAIQRQDPESFQQMLQYVVARKVVFDTLRIQVGVERG